MNKRLYLLITIATVMLTACGRKTSVDYLQKNLPEPISIDVRRAGNTDSYDKNSDKYQAIYRAINQNWWKMSENEESIVEGTDLKTVNNLKQIKTTSDMEYASDDEVIITFYYGDEPMEWTKSATEVAEIGNITFVLPKYTDIDKHAKGFFGVYRADHSYIHEGIYTYYFNNEVFNALSDSEKKITSSYQDVPLEIDLDYFSDITFVEVHQQLIKVNGWTHLTDHQVYWNSQTQQIVINETFSETASAEELNDAKDYFKTMSVLRGNWPMNLNIANFWLNIPEEAEVIIQIYNEKELISQDIYGEIESGVIYKHIQYEN